MDVPELLRQAMALIPGDARSDAGLAAGDVVECLDHHEFEFAFDILEDFYGPHWQTDEYWDLLANAAEQMQLDASWCRWRKTETRMGIIRADLQLTDPQTGGRRTAIPGSGVLRPMWALNSAQQPGLHAAAIWVEYMPELPPGGHGPVRLAPLSPEAWRHLTPGDVITMHERQPVAGTATITEILAPPSTK
ncbi:hypothetical protein [Actinomadura sp. 6N118]|uniref:hypothetical protein n=1 Tax=Actinomadura sp. 6N118 TaxID=3375151 RepID=UPI00379245EA